VYTYIATATDNDGLRATSAPVTVTVTSGPPITVLGPIVLNRQNGLFEQFARVFNPTPNDFPNGVRVFVRLATNDTTNVVWNANGTNSSGVPFIDVHTPLLSGGHVDLLIQYYVPNARSVPMATLTVEPLPFVAPPIIQAKVMSVAQAGGATTIEFTTAQNCVYYLQGSADLVHWNTLSGPIRGTGSAVRCTEANSGSRRFYRAIAIR